MRPDLRERRKETWNRLIVQGFPYRQVCDHLGEKYDVTPNAIEKDISRMDDWIGDLIAVDDVSGYSRLMEIRQNRQRLQRMADEARRETDRDEELRIRRMIDKAVQLDVMISQSLGITDRAPSEVNVSGDMAHDHDHDHEHAHAHATVPFNAAEKSTETGDGLTDRQDAHLAALDTGPEEIPVETRAEDTAHSSEETGNDATDDASDERTET